MYLLLISISIFISSSLLINQPLSASELTYPQIASPSAIVVDAETGFVLFEKNARERRPIASLTKVMTALVAEKEVKNWNTYATASQAACDVGESEICIEIGEQILLKDLLFAVLLKSANDASTMLAESIAGRADLFIKLMNREAQFLKLRDTFFSNPHGLYAANHFSSAYDCSVIAREALSFPLLREVFQTTETTIPWPGRNIPRKLKNHNKLLHQYSFVKGIKTGYVRQSGHCLISYADFGNQKVIAVVLGAKSSEECYADSLNLLTFGHSRFEKKKIISKGQVVGFINERGLLKKKRKLTAIEDVFVWTPVGFKDVRMELETFPSQESKGREIAGIIKIYKGNKLSFTSFAEVAKDGVEDRKKVHEENKQRVSFWEILKKIL